MANQPSKYSKFLVGAASAALVASAVAPVASAADFKDTKGNTHEEAINALSDSGVIKGYSDGTFLPNKTLTRSDVVKMMGKWLVTEGHAIPADARTNPRFTDLSTKSNAELLDYAAVVKDAGVFIGSNGKLLAVDNITRENMALVLVRAFDTVEKIDLATYVAGQDFKRDVKDLTSAKSEARAAIDVLDFFDITNPTVATFNPKGNTTRGHFATFLHKTINADFSKVAGEAAEGVVSVKAVNATTVEVAFKEDAKDVNASDYSIEGLAISNAAVKQTDSKVVVLTTAVQTGDKEYTLKSGESTLGTFKGISAVIPTKITMNTTSEQGVVGKEVTLKADIGVKEAGVAVTFNVKADDKLNKDQVVEAVTNAEGIATYSYTQYAAGNDDVAVYPTGAPAVRDLAKVYWGVDSILTIVADDKKGEEINNGENKVYKVTYKDAKTGKAVANQKLHVTFAENVETTIDKITHATVNGKNPYQLTNGKTEAVTVTTNSNGEASVTVSGLNTKATPVVFLDDSVNNRVSGNERLENTELQAKAAQLVIGAVQSSYAIEVVRDGKEEAATGLNNGRKYKVTVKTKDGKVAANETVNVSFDEVLDRNMNTNTSAIFTNKDGLQHKDAPGKGQQQSIKLNAKGEGSFIIATATANVKEYATPVVWIDINSSNAKSGTLDEGEPTKVADITYFVKEALTDGVLKAYDSATSNVNEIEEDDKFAGNKTAYFKFTAANQSGNEIVLDPREYDRIEASFTVFNTGSNDVIVYDSKGVEVDVVSPGRNLPVTVNVDGNRAPMISVSSANKTTDVRVEARGTAIPVNNRNNNWNNNSNNNAQTINLGGHTAKVSFVSTLDIGLIHTGIVKDINVKDQEIEFDGKTVISYKGASYKNVNSVTLTESDFVKLVEDNLGTIKVTVTKDANDKYTFEIVSLTTGDSSVVGKVNAATTGAQVQSAIASLNQFKALTKADKATAVTDILALVQAGAVTEADILAKLINVATTTLDFGAATTYSANTPAVLAVKATDEDTSLNTGTKKFGITANTAGTVGDGITVEVDSTNTNSSATTTSYDAGTKTLTVTLSYAAGNINSKVQDVIDAIEKSKDIDVTVHTDLAKTDFAGELANLDLTTAGGVNAAAATKSAVELTFTQSVNTSVGATISLNITTGGATVATTGKVKSVDNEVVVIELDTAPAAATYTIEKVTGVSSFVGTAVTITTNNSFVVAP